MQGSTLAFLLHLLLRPGNSLGEARSGVIGRSKLGGDYV